MHTFPTRLASGHLARGLAITGLASFLALGSGTGTAAASSSVDTASFAQSDPGSSEAIPDIVERVMPSVVTVYAGNDRGLSAGTGFVYDDDGHIVTNWHVVADMDQFVVELNDKSVLPAKLSGIDPRDDIAVLEVDRGDAPDPVTLGDVGDLRLGDPVIAIGTPTGFLPGTVSTGVISGLDRDQLAAAESSCQAYSDMIQHDAAISQGNSGGPLFNMDGEVIGINTLGLPLNEAGVPNQNLNFSVPASRIEKMAGQIIDTGQVSIPLLGVKTRLVTSDFAGAELFQVSARVTEVFGGTPADDAGLQRGDEITAIDGNTFSVESGLTSQMVNYDPGDTIEVTFRRDGDEQTVDVTLAETPQRVLENCTLDGGSEPEE